MLFDKIFKKISHLTILFQIRVNYLLNDVAKIAKRLEQLCEGASKSKYGASVDNTPMQPPPQGFFHFQIRE